MMIAALAVTALVGCGSKETGKTEGNEEGVETEFDLENDITVISREDGSGTRGAFVELVGVEQKNEAGEKVDYTTVEATITNNTSVMMTAVANDEYAIGYISLGSLNDTVKAVKIDGVEASIENVANGTYAVNRPFNLAINGEVTEAAQDFINYILSALSSHTLPRSIASKKPFFSPVLVMRFFSSREVSLSISSILILSLSSSSPSVFFERISKRTIYFSDISP